MENNDSPQKCSHLNTVKLSTMEKLKQESTWRGLISLIAIAGVQIAPEHTEALVSLAVAAVSAINILKSD